MIAALVLALVQEAGVSSDLDRANDRDKPPSYQVQAIQKLRERGAGAVEPVLAWVRSRGRREMGLLFTQFLGELKDPRIADLLADLARDRDFFWRPAAMDALAEHRDRRHLTPFRAGLKDPLWGVRAASVRGLEGLKDRESLPEIRRLLGDDAYEVRAQAAKTMHAMGDETGLPVLVESLRSAVAWFDIDYGQIAREDAWKFLKELAGDDFGFKPWEPARQREPGLARWEAWIARKFPDWREKVPPNARAQADAAEYVFGYELRSCQRGDFFFRLDVEGNLVLGYFTLQRAPLSKEERERFDRALARVRAVDADLPYGLGGCDFEQHYLREPNGRFRKLWVGIGGRPPEADPFVRVCQELVGAKFGDGEAADFKERAALFRQVD